MVKRNSERGFAKRCYELLRQVPAGRVTTYGELARALGSRAYRAVGQAMHRNPYAPIVPCHRVIRANGAIGGYALGVRRKIRLLGKEGLRIENGKVAHWKEVCLSAQDLRAKLSAARRKRPAGK